MKTKFFIFILAIFAVASFGFFENPIVYASQSDDCIYYVSLGDSIAVGYNLADYNAGVSDSTEGKPGQFVPGSYAYNFKSVLEGKYGANNVLSANYATSGDNSVDLLNKLESEEMQTWIQKADIVTICIGANDILGPALENIAGYILKDGTSGSVSIAQMENQLSLGLQNFEGSSVQEGSFDKILKVLYELNPDANYIFTNVYNPYKELALPSSLASFIGYTNFSQEKIDKMGEITSIYLAGGTNSQNQEVFGLNQILQSKINDFGHDNFVLVDTYGSFNQYTMETTPKYTDLVFSSLTKDSVINVTELMGGGVDVIMSKTDPHPTEQGHALIYAEFVSYFENEICTVTLDYNDVVIDNKSSELKLYRKDTTPNLPQLVADNANFAGWKHSDGKDWTTESKIVGDCVLYAKWGYSITYNLFGGTNHEENPTAYTSSDSFEFKAPTKDGYMFDGWYSDSDFVNKKQSIQLGESGNINLYAKWSPIGYAITYVLDGGTNHEENPTIYTTQTQEIVLKNPTKQGFDFAGWYTDAEFTNKITKIQPGDMGDLTLYAKWAKMYKVTFDSKGGTSCASVDVEEGYCITEIPQTTKEHTSDNIFAGWYYNNQLWDFENDTVASNMTLVAKWVGLVCSTNNLQQTIDSTEAIVFEVELPNATFAWYVDEQLQQQTSNTFAYIPNDVGEHVVYCIVNNTKSICHTISVEYIVPETIELNQPQKNGNTYLLTVKNGQFYDPSKIVWFKAADEFGGNFEQIGTGASCNVQITSTCYVYAVYDNTIITEKTQITYSANENNKPNQSDNGILFVIIITVVIIGVVLTVIIIAKRKANKVI